MKRGMRLRSVLFPLPVLPTMAVILPGSAANLILVAEPVAEIDLVALLRRCVTAATERGYPLQSTAELAQQKRVWNSEAKYHSDDEMADYFRSSSVKVILDFGAYVRHAKEAGAAGPIGLGAPTGRTVRARSRLPPQPCRPR